MYSYYELLLDRSRIYNILKLINYILNKNIYCLPIGLLININTNIY